MRRYVYVHLFFKANVPCLHCVVAFSPGLPPSWRVFVYVHFSICVHLLFYLYVHFSICCVYVFWNNRTFCSRWPRVTCWPTFSSCLWWLLLSWALGCSSWWSACSPSCAPTAPVWLCSSWSRVSDSCTHRLDTPQNLNGPFLVWRGDYPRYT